MKGAFFPRLNHVPEDYLLLDVGDGWMFVLKKYMDMCIIVCNLGSIVKMR